MPSSPEKIAANRRNSLKSCGPRTPEGKQRSRRNGLKHGLTGEGIVVPDEDAVAIEERFEAFCDALKPRDEVAEALVHRAALLVVRMERSARHEAAEITREMLGAEDREADERAEELRRLTELIVKEPAEATRKLRRIPEGIDWMIGLWESLRADLLGKSSRKWGQGQCERASELMGVKARYDGSSRLVALSQATLGLFQLLGEGDWPGLAAQERREAARAELGKIIDGEIARLEGVREGLDHQAIARDRAGAQARALFSATPEAILARKYEAAAERGFYRALKQIERLNAQADEAEEVAASPPAEEKCDELASPLPAVESEREEVPKPAPRPRTAAPTARLDPNSVPFKHPNPFDVTYPTHNPLVRG
jgi:hypothetical protein